MRLDKNVTSPRKCTLYCGFMRGSLQVHVVHVTGLVRCKDNVMLNKSKMKGRNVQGEAGGRVRLSGVLKSPPTLCSPSEQDASSIARTRRSLPPH
jgi:hypothetical protein